MSGVFASNNEEQSYYTHSYITSDVSKKGGTTISDSCTYL